MRRDDDTIRIVRLLTAALLVTVLGGCAQTKSWLDGMRESSTDARDPVIVGAPDAEHYLDELYSLAAGDPATQAEIYADAESASTLTPGPQTNLRFGLVLATPGHPGADPLHAQSLLREVLANQELMTPAEVSLATIHLKSAERLSMLDAEARQLRASNSRTERTEQQAINQRLATVEAENRRLRRDIDAAEDKLDAITKIERSIREQDQ